MSTIVSGSPSATVLPDTSRLPSASKRAHVQSCVAVVVR